MRLWKCMCARVQVCVCMRHREHWEGLSVFWRLSDWACHSGTGKVSSAQASEPEPVSQPDLNTMMSWQPAQHRPVSASQRERKHLQPAIYLSVWLTMGYTWYNEHPQLTAALLSFPGVCVPLSLCGVCVCVCGVCVCVLGSYLIWVLTSEFQGAPKPQNASFTNMSKLILIICTNKKVFGCTNCTNAIGLVNKIEIQVPYAKQKIGFFKNWLKSYFHWNNLAKTAGSNFILVNII